MACVTTLSALDSKVCDMSFLVVLAALGFLMFVAYRGYSVILFAPVAALGAVLLTDPSLVAPMFTGLFMEKLVGFLKLYFPVFLLGAIFGKVIELSPRIPDEARRALPMTSSMSPRRCRPAWWMRVTSRLSASGS